MREPKSQFEKFLVRLIRWFQPSEINKVLKENDDCFRIKYNRKKRAYCIVDGRLMKKFPNIIPDVKHTNSRQTRNGRIVPRIDHRTKSIIEIPKDGWILDDGTVIYLDKREMKIYRLKFSNAKPVTDSLNPMKCAYITVLNKMLSPSEAVYNARMFNPERLQIIWSRFPG